MVLARELHKEGVSFVPLLEEINDHFASLNSKIDMMIELMSPRKIGMALDRFGSPVSPCLKPKNSCSKETENEGKQAVEIDVFNLGNKEREKSRPH
jgi:hypothetical protein